ncbi:MAG TPA: DUF4350 domain-containing protein [Pyrinomonadaceae bacterium]|nr:DUF4350 domain-containing protein [Pyrinomonadaceae bacterium]
MRNMTAVVLFVLLAAVCLTARAQQVADPDFKPPIPKPAYREGRGPVVLIDEAHNNFHTASGRYQAFAELLRRDGYTVKPSPAKFTKEYLKTARVLVISNAINERNAGGDWSLPTPSAFTDEEIEAVREWVREGGSLLLIADHMPAAGAAEKLALAFGFRFSNGFAMDESKKDGTLFFKLADGSLKEHPITKGRNAAERIDTVATFTGSAFQLPAAAQPLFVFGNNVKSLEPEVAWKFDEKTKRVPVKGWAQGAVLRFGKGRVAAFGEAAMFSAQLAGAQRTPVGMNSPVAKQNPQFLLNVMHWLTGVLK